MQKIYLKFLKFGLALGLFGLPSAAGAQSNPVSSGLGDLRSVFGFGGTGLSGTTDLRTLLQRVISLMLFFAGGIAVIFVIIGGYQYVTSAGNEEAAEKGKNTLVNAIIGIVVVVLSYVIINVVVKLVSGTSLFSVY